jgi:hypothetical protein
MNPKFPAPSVDMAEIKQRYHSAEVRAKSTGG